MEMGKKFTKEQGEVQRFMVIKVNEFFFLFFAMLIDASLGISENILYRMNSISFELTMKVMHLYLLML